MEFTEIVHLAASNGDLERVQILVEQRNDTERTFLNHDSLNPLYVASENGHLPVVQYLVEQGADKEIMCNGGKSPLLIASSNGHLPVVTFLVEQGADIEKTDGNNGWTPLMVACMDNHVDVARYLLEQGADRDKVGFYGMTSLHFAAGNNFLKLAKLLMVYGANLTARNEDGDLPIDVAWGEEMKQAICDEPRRRMDEAPGKRAIDEQDRHPNIDTTASAQQEGEDMQEGRQHNNKRPVEGEVEDGEEVADGEDQNSDPSSDEENDSAVKR